MSVKPVDSLGSLGWALGKHHETISNTKCLSTGSKIIIYILKPFCHFPIFHPDVFRKFPASLPVGTPGSWLPEAHPFEATLEASMWTLCNAPAAARCPRSQRQGERIGEGLGGVFSFHHGNYLEIPGFYGCLWIAVGFFSCALEAFLNVLFQRLKLA